MPTPHSRSAKPDEAQYKALVQQVLDEARRQGASAAEAALGLETGLSVTVRLGDVETLEYHRDKGLGVTVYFGHSKGSASTSDFSDQAIRDTVGAACGIARHTAADEYSGLADADLMAWHYPDLDLYHPWDVSSEAAIDLAQACESAGRRFDPRIVNSEGASVATHEGLHVYSNSHGFVGAYPSSRHSISCALIGQQDGSMQRDYWFSVARHAKDLEDGAAIGRRAAERAVARLQARRLSTRQAPVIFAAEIATSLIGNFLRAIRGGSLYRKSSFLLDSLDTRIFPEWMNIIERPHVRRGLASAPYDGEGVVTHDRDLVAHGVLKGYVLDSYSARRLGMKTTGNAGGTHNLIVEPGPDDLPALMQRMGKGLLVTELMGQGVNIVTGDYSRGAAGYWVENGEIQYAVEEITVAGKLRDMYQRILAVGRDVDHRHSLQTGSILIENMTIAGE